MTKSAVSCGFSHIEKILNEKLYFLCSVLKYEVKFESKSVV